MHVCRVSETRKAAPWPLIGINLPRRVTIMVRGCGAPATTWSLTPCARYEALQSGCQLETRVSSSQMTKGNVGSLLVFDASKMGVNGKPSEEAVVGIITERGTCLTRKTA